MVRSMTGYGHSANHFGGYKVQIEIKSVNHRYSEIVVRIPREWTCFEEAMKRAVQQRVKRGRVDIFIHREREGEGGSAVDIQWPMVEAYMQAADRLRNRYGLTDSVRLQDILQLPDVIAMRDEATLSEEEMEKELLAGLREALDGLCRMRAREGEHLARDIMDRLLYLESIHAEMAGLAPTVVEEYRTKLKQKLEDLQDSAFTIDEYKFGMEVALFAERSNIDEELTRLRSHFEQCRQLLQSEDPVGRKLDFLIQEMNREVNTIGSKANHLALVNRVVDMKAELEKIREQVANME